MDIKLGSVTKRISQKLRSKQSSKRKFYNRPDRFGKRSGTGSGETCICKHSLHEYMNKQVTTAQQQSRLKELIAKGKEQGYLTYGEVNDHLPDDISDPEQIEDIIRMINDMGILVQESAPESDDLMAEGDSTDELAAEEAAAVLVAVENETGRTTDPVRMYMREMGTVDLLTREGEIEIAKRIEEGTRELMAAIADWPSNVSLVIAEWDKVLEGEKKLTDIISGYLNPMEHVPSALAQQQAAEAAEAEKLANGEEIDEDGDHDDEHEGGLDPEEATERFEEIRSMCRKSNLDYPSKAP